MINWHQTLIFHQIHCRSLINNFNFYYYQDYDNESFVQVYQKIDLVNKEQNFCDRLLIKNFKTTNSLTF